MPLGQYRERVLIRAKQMLARAHEHQVASKEEAIQKAIQEIVQEEQGKLAQREKILSQMEEPTEDPEIKKEKDNLDDLSKPDTQNSIANLLKNHEDLKPFGESHIRASWIRGLMFDPNIGKNHYKVNEALPKNLRFGDPAKLAKIISRLPTEPTFENTERETHTISHVPEDPDERPPTLEEIIQAMMRGQEE